ncbi:MAG: hypothetical protein QX197_06640 [Methylococcaceae bacterium]
MPQLIKHIDAIAREKQRNVLFLTFRSQKSANADSWNLFFDYNESKVPIRKTVCQWLTEHNISWYPCAHFATESFVMGYFGRIYLDIPFDENDKQYQLVRDYLEHPDGTPRDPKIGFWCLLLEDAMKNAFHDEPGYWEKRAELM